MNKLIIFEDTIYISGTISYAVHPSTLTFNVLDSYHSFMEFEGELYGNSDEKGITLLKTGENIS